MMLFFLPTITQLIAIFVQLLITCGDASEVEDDKTNRERVAFVFAGGVRSFVVPVVHDAIRYNLIHGFCPPKSCIGDVFVRLSIDDNIHNGVGANAKGLNIKGSPDKLENAFKYINRLAHDSPDSSLVYEVVNIGSKDESDQMDEITRKSLKQRIYRDLDARRYSMYFNRWAAYQMAMEEEKEKGFKYDWVIHARLDMGWGSPVQPHSVWSKERIWVPDVWFADVPDTFAILPRWLAESYYTLSGQFERTEVMCLGGPNFDPKTLEEGELRLRGYTDAEILIAQHELCLKKHKYEGILDRTNNITWSLAGTSEKILGRKLFYNGISRDKGTLGLTTFFTFIVRYPVDFVCYYSEPKGIIYWVKATQHASIPMSLGCYTMWKDMLPFYNTNYGPNCDVDNYRSKYPLVMKPQSTCLIDKRMTDWNFLPLRIRRRGDMCFTMRPHPADVDPKQSIALTMSKCRDVITILKDKSGTADYDSLQLMSFFPLSPIPQRITTWNYEYGHRCLTVSSEYAFLTRGGARVEGTDYTEARPSPLLEFQPCHAYPQHVSQLFRFQFIRQGSKKIDTSINGDFEWIANRTLYEAHLPERSATIIRWVGENEHYCIAYDSHTDMDAPNDPPLFGNSAPRIQTSVLSLNINENGMESKTVDGSLVGLGPCLQSQEWTQQKGPSSHSHTANRNTVFVLEKSKIKGPTV